MSVHFDSPPVNEVVIATFFDPPPADLRNEHIGLFWGEIRDRFPVVQQRRPTAIPDSLTRDAGMDNPEIFPMPRYWFVAEDGINLIQVQKNAFMLNWRRRDADYPGFTHIKPNFDRYYTIFSDFVRAELDVALEISSCGLTYVNTVEQSEFWPGPSDTHRVINSFWVPEVDLQSPGHQDFDCRYGYQVSDAMRIDIAISSGSATQQPSIPLLIIEIKATGRPEPQTKSQADVWFDHANDTIMGTFLNLTDSEAQRHY